MTREEAIEILIAVAVCDRPILSCDFCARYAGIGTHCNYPHDEEIEEAVLLLKGASKDMAISALRQQEHFRDLTKMVEPLTLGELREMGGEPYYHVSLQRDRVNHWAVLDPFVAEHIEAYHYGERWLAYRQKPEEGTV